MMEPPVTGRFCLAALLAAALAGCGGSDKPVPVTGKVTVNGAPVAGAGVTFHPQDGKGRPATGETDQNGTYHLTTINPSDGALPGEYRVTLVWDEPQHPYLQLRDGAPQKESLRADYEKWKATHKTQPSPIPAKYGTPGSTPLTQKVPAANGKADFEVPAK
jgi:hypothetical protein